jgi:hypothetical protein
MANGVRDGWRDSVSCGDQVEWFVVKTTGDSLQVLHPRVERQIRDLAVRQAETARVENYERELSLEPPCPFRDRSWLPLDMAERRLRH